MSEVFVLAGWDLSASGRRVPGGAASSLGRNGGIAAILLTALVSGVVGFGAGAFVARAPRTPVLADARLLAGSQPQPPTPLQSPAAPPIALAQAAAVPVVEPPPASQPAATKAAPDRAKASAMARARVRQKSRKTDEPKAAAAKPHSRPGAASRPAAQPASCERDARGDDCRRAVVQADLHLQDVFQSAVRRGVSQEVLVGYRSRWAGLRDRDSEDPARLIEGYGALAYDLGRENAR
jgi:hypothetical protein